MPSEPSPRGPWYNDLRWWQVPIVVVVVLAVAGLRADGNRTVAEWIGQTIGVGLVLYVALLLFRLVRGLFRGARRGAGAVGEKMRLDR